MSSNRGPGRPVGSTFNVIKADSSAGGPGDTARVRRMPLFAEGQAGQRVPFNYSPKCRVCNSRHIFELNTMLSMGRGYQMIFKILPDSVSDPEHDDYLTTGMLRHHVSSGHLPTQQIAITSIIDDRMQQLGKAIEDGEQIILDHVILGRTMMDRYFAGLAEGRTMPNTTEIISVMKMFAGIESLQKSTVDTSVYNQVVSIMIDVVKAVAPENFDEIMFRVSENPIIKGLMAERQRHAERIAIGAA